MASRQVFLVTLVLGALFAGCVEPGNEIQPASGARGEVRIGGGIGSAALGGIGNRVMVYDKEGLTPLGSTAFPSPINITMTKVPDGSIAVGNLIALTGCGEPTGGASWKTGSIFQVCLDSVYRSKDHGSTWQKVSTQVSSPTTLDPYMWVDPVTGRVYSIQLYLGCSWLAYSDDEGASWITNPIACGIPVNDHQTLAGGPTTMGLPTPIYRHILYYCVNQLQDTMCARSLDGGLTWAGTIAQLTAYDVEAGTSCSAINGHVIVAPDGTGYLPKRQCNRAVALTTTNNGLTWEERIVSRTHRVIQSLAHDPTVAADSASNAFYFWTGDDGVLRLSTSTNKGQTWSPGIRVSPPGMSYTLFETSVAGDPGRAAVAYYGTYQPRDQRWKYASQAPNETVWHLYLTYVDEAVSDDPRFTTVQINPTEDPIQRGCIWLQGGGGGPNQCRNLYDFFDTSMGKDGRVYVHYVDGCIDKCVTWTPADGRIPRVSQGMTATVQSGPGLLEATSWLEPPASLG